MGIVISTHLPPPVMMESTDVLKCVTHMLCWTWAMYFSAAASSENDHGNMNLASNTASVPSTIPSRVAAIQGMAECLTRPPSGVALVPGPVEVLGGGPKLHDQIAGEVLGLGLPSLFPPQPHQGGLVLPHDDPGVRAADEGSAIRIGAVWLYESLSHRMISDEHRFSILKVSFAMGEKSIPKVSIRQIKAARALL